MTTLSAAKLPDRNRRSCTSGSRARSSHHTNPGSSTAAAASRLIVAGEPQPHCWLCISPSTSAPIPPISSGTPGQSIRPPGGVTLRGSVVWASTSIATPTGRFT